MTHRYAAALQDPNVQAFLHMIRVGEGTPDEAGYRRLFGGELVDSLADHPRRTVTRKLGGTPITSTAAGAYQFLSRTWDECARALELPDFGRASQDAAALYLIDRRKALADVLAGRTEQAIAKCAREWASLPGSPYGQPVKTLAQALAAYRSAGGQEPDAAPPAGAEPITPPTVVIEPPASAPQPPEKTMPLAPVVAALLPSIVEMIPRLGKIFGSGTAVQERNVQAATLAAQIVTDAVGARNVQEAAEIIKADPAQAATAAAAVEARWFELAESGGGGIDGARKADAAAVASGEPVWHSPSFIIACALLPLVYMVVGAVVGLFGAPFSDDVRSAIANGIVGLILGGLIGYYYGQTTMRNRTPQA